MYRFFFLIIAVALGALTILPQSKNAVEIKKIDAMAKSIDRTVKIDQGRVIVADIAVFDKDKPEWKVFESEKALEKFREQTETYTIAFNWKRRGKVIASNFTLFSPSGDWSKFIFHYFRADGTLALVKSELRTFYGDYIVKENRYFDLSGRVIKKSIKYFDLTSGKRKKPSRELRGDNPSLYKVDYFLNAKKLPFAHLISDSK